MNLLKDSIQLPTDIIDFVYDRVWKPASPFGYAPQPMNHISLMTKK